MPRSLIRPMALLAAGIVVASLVVHAWRAVRTAAYVDFVTGVWLTLADDLVHGVFYRPLVGPDGCGGTRCFPLWFVSIGALMRLGLSPVAAGFVVSAVAAASLAAGVRRLLLALRAAARRCGGGRGLRVRPRVRPAGLLAFAATFSRPRWSSGVSDFSCPPRIEERPGMGTLAAAAACFTLAFATKVTSLYAPAGIVVSLLWMARPGAAVRLGGMVAAGVTATVAVVAVASSGRAIESWLEVRLRRCRYGRVAAKRAPRVRHRGGGSLPGVRERVAGGGRGAWLAMVRARGPKMLAVLFPVTIIATTVVLASPGTSFHESALRCFRGERGDHRMVGGPLRRDSRRWPSAGLLLLSLVAARQSPQPVLDAGSPAARR
ncbi:MAG: hypothetical protein MZU84_03950 [Sphingobacterium sp.]|nr:hypothetical protein [Sphingobacterium sp.]